MPCPSGPAFAPCFKTAVGASSKSGTPIVVLMTLKDEGKQIPTCFYNKDVGKAASAKQVSLVKVIYGKEADFVKNNKITSAQEGIFGVDKHGNVVKTLSIGASDDELLGLISFVKDKNTKRAEQLNKKLEKAKEYEKDGKTSQALSEYKSIVNMKCFGWPQHVEAENKVTELTEKAKATEEKPKETKTGK